MVPGLYVAAVATGTVVIIGHLETVTASSFFREGDILVVRDRRREIPPPPLPIFRRYESCAEGSGYAGSCSAFFHSPRVDRSGDEEREALASQVAALAAVRRTFGGQRQRVPLRSRPGANALAA